MSFMVLETFRHGPEPVYGRAGAIGDFAGRPTLQPTALPRPSRDERDVWAFTGVCRGGGIGETFCG